ncbi:sialate O-acetylesterase [Prosthecobacter sp.]|uniref:sialate O-acetylesterase n=1 Tax=Prosthecobacter sp. TaxID=1965333 RepID=UPI0037831F06
MKLIHRVLVLFVSLCCSTQAAKVKVFILCGQSNMVGHGKAEEGGNPRFDFAVPQGKDNPREVSGGLGCLRAMVNESPAKFGPGGTTPLVDANGRWLVRGDVKILAYCDGKTRKGGLGLGYAAPGAVTWFGPEFGFGHVVGRALEEDVLILKVAAGGTSLAKDWRPPTAVVKRGGVAGPRYTHMVSLVRETLTDLSREFPEFAGRGYEVAGFGWHQGWQDGGEKLMADEYEANMADFIQDVRKEFGSGMAFVIANSGFFGDKLSGIRLEVLKAQNAMADSARHPELKGNVAVVDTRPMWREKSVSPSNFDFHWNHNGYTHYEMGAGTGEAMLRLLNAFAAH